MHHHSTNPRRSRRLRGTLLTTALLAGTSSVLAVTAAGATSARPPSARTHEAKGLGVAAARQVVAKWEKPPVWRGPTAKVNTAGAKGKSVYLINLTEEIPALHEWAAVAQQQLAKFGVNAKICDGQGAPGTIQTCMEQAIAARPSAIVAMALDTKFIANDIKTANKDGIKVITAQTGTPGIPHGTGAVAEVTFDYPQVGRILGAWFAATSGCKGYPQIITTTSSRQPSAAEVSGIVQEIKKLCGTSTPSNRAIQNVLIPNWATQLATVTRSDLTADPTLKYMIPLYDGMTIYMAPAAEAIHRSTPVEMASFNATPVVMQTELSKKSPLVADVGGPNAWFGYAMTDEILRVLTGAKVVASENVPLRLFDASNIHTINVKKNESTWYGPVNFACNYDKLWGLKCS